MRQKVSLLKDARSAFLRPGSPAIVTLVCAAIVLAFFMNLNIQAQNPERRGLKIAVIDISQVLDAYGKREDSNKALQEFQLEKQDKIEEKKMEIKTRMEKKELLLPGSSERKKLEDEISNLEVELGVMQKNAAREITQKYSELLVELYNDIMQECVSYARAHEFDLVLKKESADFEGLTPQEVKFNIKTQKIVYNAPRLDITSAIIEHLKKNETRVPSEAAP